MILVTGATGSIGGHLVRRLANDGVPFRAMVRDEARGAALGVDFVVGDLDDPDSVARALDGVDRLFLNAGGAVPADGEQPMVRQQRDAIDAARRAGVGRIVKISVWGAEEGGRLAVGAHWRIEQHLKASGVEWSLLQPSGFMQNFATGAGSFTADGDLIGNHLDTPVSYIDAQDIAACAAVLLTGSRGAGETYVLTGPEALTQTEIAARLTTVVGTTVRHVGMPPAEMAAALTAQGLPARFADDVATLWAGIADGALATTTDAVRELTGRPPRTFDEFLADHRDALRAVLAPRH
ncbi:SDR family oxidoreductase [Polymorphospora rubra]|uniref:SDR family oxidoreductase n=1 Tax=Polymorphospora rubra TaxID=338584 RepID=UPI0034010BF5